MPDFPEVPSASEIWKYEERTLSFDVPMEGSITADGTEQTLVLDEVEGNPSRYLEGYVDVNEMQNGDEIIMRYYVNTGTAYRKYYSLTVSNKQDLPVAWLNTKPTKYGTKITLQQTAGTYRTFKYLFFRKKTA